MGSRLNSFVGALASVADLCCLELSSRDVLAPESWSVIAKGGEQIYYGPAVRWRREKPGTVVCVRDAFYNLPIRRLSHPNTQRTVDLVRREIERYALIAPHVTFTLEKAIKERDGSTSQSRIMTIPKSSSALAAFHNIYGRALAEHVDEVNVMAGSLKIEGFISLQGAPSKAFQFLYVNRYPLEYSDLHRTIESRFASTSFSKPNESAAGFDGDPTDQHSSTRKLECRPVYCLNLHVPRDHVDVCLEPNKRTVQFQDRHAIEDLVLRAVETFLERNGFRALASSSSVRIRGNDEISSHSSRKRIKPEIGCDKGKSAPSLPAGRRASRPSVEISASPADSEMQPMTCQSSVFQASEASLPLISAGTWEETRDPHGSTSPLDGIKHRFTRQDLRGLKVLCQVDRKFIACIVKLDHQRDTLVLIDQHAADERVRVERFLRAFSTQFLDDSSNSDGVQRWGFAVSLQDASGDALVELPRAPDNQGQLVVHTVPELLLSKLSKGNELRNVVRSFITMLDDHFHFQSGSPDQLGSHDETHPAEASLPLL
ncbi:DNA mismatch repair protein [Tulasnella sp. 403]|nr:DNA mismatch repair protein [Tulasnella sp. 403]